jgi:hypothetical protein
MLQSLQLIYVWYPSTQIWVFGCCCWSHVVENLIPFYANLSFWVLSLEPYCWESDTLLFKFEFWGVILRTILLRIWYPSTQIWVCGCYPQNHIVENLIPFYANLSFWVLSSEPYWWESDTLFIVLIIFVVVIAEAFQSILVQWTAMLKFVIIYIGCKLGRKKKGGCPTNLILMKPWDPDKLHKNKGPSKGQNEEQREREDPVWATRAKPKQGHKGGKGNKLHTISQETNLQLMPRLT